MKNNFNFIAPFYDRLGGLIFGNTLLESQRVMLSYLKEGQCILILGGGSGAILTELDKLDIGLIVSYIELSPAMIKLAEDKQPFTNLKLDFITADALQIALPEIDVVITNYFLDVFSPNNLKIVMKKVDEALSTSGIWLCTDFRKTNSFYKNVLIKLMYIFFKIVSQLEGSSLQDFEKQFYSLGYKKTDSKFYFGNMIESAIYKKTQTR